jgi:glycolate oxidase FAD binding subunit
MPDAGAQIARHVSDAAQRKVALCVRGGGTKDFYGNEPRGEPLDMRSHAGIVSYEPSELVVSARCGTLLAELENAIAEKSQILAFEPPRFGAGATIGGCVAAGLSGPRRASAGALRDYVLGVRVVDGRGRVLSFGGQVMKNVAGYDVSRLMAGSLGTLGAILEVSLKLLPAPRAERTQRLELGEARAIDALNRWAGRALPLSASAWQEGVLALRFSGAETAVTSAANEVGGELLPPVQAAAFWEGIRDQSDAFFSGDLPIWRFAVPTTTPPLGLPGASLIEWGGAQRWLRSSADSQALREAARNANGHATLFRSPRRDADTFATPTPGVLELHRSLKAVFDPVGILNPGRMYRGL